MKPRKIETLKIGKPKPFRLKDIAGIMKSFKPGIVIHTDGTIDVNGPGFFATSLLKQTPTQIRKLSKRWEQILVVLQRELARWFDEVTTDLVEASISADLIRPHRPKVVWKKKATTHKPGPSR